MRVLVACEYSGKVREAFRKLGHDAWSCDLLPADDGSEFHIQGDCMPIIMRGWDLIIMHPPCTALCVSGNRWYGRGMPKHQERIDSIEWTTGLFELAKQHAKSVAMENPVGVLPMKPTQYIQPWQFGHGETKRTGLWLHNLRPLEPTDIVDGRENRIHKMPRHLIAGKFAQKHTKGSQTPWLRSGAANRLVARYTIRYSVQTKTGVTHMQEKTERNAEIVEMRKTMSVDEIAAKLGLNRQRIYQILRRAKARAE